MSKHKIEFKEKCSACNGTGLYVGLADNNTKRDGSAVICSKCKGSGEYLFVHEYEDLKERERRKDVERVFEVNPGIVIGTNNGALKLTDFGGMPYNDWLAGKPFPSKSENRKYTCPRWWYQLADYKKKPQWNECGAVFGRSFFGCPHFKTKASCWNRFT